MGLHKTVIKSKKLVYVPGYQRSSHFCSVMIRYLQNLDNKRCSVQYIDIFLSRIELYCSSKCCNIYTDIL